MDFVDYYINPVLSFWPSNGLLIIGHANLSQAIQGFRILLTTSSVRNYYYYYSGSLKDLLVNHMYIYFGLSFCWLEILSRLSYWAMDISLFILHYMSFYSSAMTAKQLLSTEDSIYQKTYVPEHYIQSLETNGGTLYPKKSI